MIAYDFDGVLITDYAHVPHISDEEFFNLTSFSHPIFEPDGEYVVVTARTPKREPATRAVLEKISNQPVTVFFRDDINQDPGLYKAEVLNTLPSVTVFVESSAEQAATIAQHWNGRVIHFGSLISNNLNQQLTSSK